MSAVQLNFTLRTSTNVKTVHLLGSWDNYHGQLPLSRASGGKPGSWKGAFRFQLSMMKPGQRYWYYYIMDGYHVSHDPGAEFTVEPTTGRKLNILDVPGDMPTRKPAGHTRLPSHHDVAKGRALSPSKIQHPKPSKPYMSRQFCQAGLSPTSMQALNSQFGKMEMSDSDSDISSTPPSSLGGSSISSRGGSTSPSSLSSLSDSGSACSCQRYGITTSGERVRIHCGGKRCGGLSQSESSSGSELCSSDSDEDYRRARTILRQQAIRVRR